MLVFLTCCKYIVQNFLFLGELDERKYHTPFKMFKFYFTFIKDKNVFILLSKMKIHSFTHTLSLSIYIYIHLCAYVYG